MHSSVHEILDEIIRAEVQLARVTGIVGCEPQPIFHVTETCAPASTLGMPNYALPVLVAVLVLSVAAGAQTPASPSVAADVETLRNIIQQTANAINSNDAAGIMAHYSKDILVSYPGIPDTTYDTLERSYQQMLSPNTTTVTVPTIDEILVSGDLATIRMSWSTTITDKDTRRSSSRRATDLQVWRRENGAWKFFRGMWHHITQ